MGTTRVTPVEVIKMQRLYKELGSYAAVAREIHRCPETVSRYVKMKNVPPALRIAVDNLITGNIPR